MQATAEMSAAGMQARAVTLATSNIKDDNTSMNAHNSKMQATAGMKAIIGSPTQ
jgi:hypothetical protein